jgi:hypothetical protein
MATNRPRVSLGAPLGGGKCAIGQEVLVVVDAPAAARRLLELVWRRGRDEEVEPLAAERFTVGDARLGWRVIARLTWRSDDAAEVRAESNSLEVAPIDEVLWLRFAFASGPGRVDPTTIYHTVIYVPTGVIATAELKRIHPRGSWPIPLPAGRIGGQFIEIDAPMPAELRHGDRVYLAVHVSDGFGHERHLFGPPRAFDRSPRVEWKPTHVADRLLPGERLEVTASMPGVTAARAFLFALPDELVRVDPPDRPVTPPLSAVVAGVSPGEPDRSTDAPRTVFALGPRAVDRRPPPRYEWRPLGELALQAHPSGAFAAVVELPRVSVEAVAAVVAAQVPGAGWLVGAAHDLPLAPLDARDAANVRVTILPKNGRHWERAIWPDHEAEIRVEGLVKLRARITAAGAEIASGDVPIRATWKVPTPPIPIVVSVIIHNPDGTPWRSFDTTITPSTVELGELSFGQARPGGAVTASFRAIDGLAADVTFLVGEQIVETRTLTGKAAWEPVRWTIPADAPDGAPILVRLSWTSPATGRAETRDHAGPAVDR